MAERRAWSLTPQTLIRMLLQGMGHSSIEFRVHQSLFHLWISSAGEDGMCDVYSVYPQIIEMSDARNNFTPTNNQSRD